MISSIEVELEGCGDPGRMAACELRIIAPVVTMEAHTVQQKTVAASKARSWEKLETGPKVSKLDSRKQKTAPQGMELDASKGIVNTQNIENAKNVPKNSSPIFHEKNKLTNVVVKSRTSVNGSKTGKTRQGVADCSITPSNGQPKEVHGKKTVFVSAMKTPGTAECEVKRHCDRVKTKCWNVKEDAVGVRKGPDAMVLPLTDDLQTQTWHGRTRGSEERRSRSSSRQSTRRASQNKHRGSLDSKALPFCSDSLKTECEQTTSSVPTLSPREPASLLDVMHKKYCSQQYSLDKRARSMDMLHTIPGVPIMGMVHAHSDHAVHKAMPIWPPTPAMFIVPPATERAGKLKKVGRKSSRFPVSLPKGQGHRSRKRDQAELEAAEACTWLRAAGFPQYAQVYEDGLFPLELTSVEVDHDFLDADSIQSLLRRLNTLNKCAQMKVEAPSRKLTDDSDEEEQCALSDKWKYMRTSRRWSRKDLETSPYNVTLQTLRSASSHDSLLTDPESVGGMAGDDGETTPPKQSTLTTDGSLKMKRSTSGSFIVSPRLRRAASERIKSARNLLKRVESFKKRKKANPEISQISQPVVVDSKEMQARIQHLNCKEITPGADSDTSPTEHKSTAVSGLMSTSSDDVSDNSRTSPEVIERAKDLSLPDRPNCVSSQERINSLSNGCPGATPSPQFPPLSHTEMDSSTQAISTAAHAAVQNRLSRRSHRASHVAGSPETPHRVVTHTEVPSQTYLLPEDYVPGSFPKQLGRSETDPQPVTRVRLRTVSGTSADHNSTENHRASVYDNVLTDNELAAAHRELDLILHDLFQDINSLSQVLNSSENDTTGDTSEGTLPPLESDDSLTKPSGPGHEVVDIGTLSSQGECGTVSSHGECGTVSSHGECGTVSSHGECGTASSRDASEPEGSRERRDSGVGSSLTRAPSDRRRTRIRWHSFQKSHRPSFNSRNLQIEGFSAGQLMVLRKLALLKLTAIMEKYSPVNRTGWNWVVTRLMKKPKAPDYKDKNMFGVPLLVTLQRTGQPIPQCLLYAMRFLRKTSKDAVGIFRKSGVRSRIQKLRNDLEAKPDLVDSLDELQAYDVADLLKQYFRELPECLLTNKLSETFISIFTYVPVELRLEALQSAVILMPDENREVLQSLLLFLSDIALSSNEHQMTASNLAVCFAPSLFSICGPRNLPPTASPRTKRSNNNNNNNKGLGVPDQRELLDQKAAHECLTMMITQCKQLFMISADTLTRCRFSYMEEGEPVSLEELCKTDELSAPDVTAYIDSCIKGILKESREKFKSWTSLPGVEGVELAYKKVGDGHPLRLWKCSVEVEAPPTEVLNRILAERFMWDEDLLQWKTVEKINNQTDVFQYVRNSMAPHPTRDYCVLRSWRTDLPKGACVLVSTSIDHPGAPLLGGVRGVVLASRFLIEPCGSGRSRLTHLSRIDMRGKGPEYYVKVYGHICSNFMGKIKGSFKHGDDISQGPETKV